MREDGQWCAVGEPGEVVLRDWVNPRAYLEDEAASAQAHRFGWYHTGDVGMVDEEGRITLLDTNPAHRLQYTHNNTNTIASISDLLYASQTTTLGYDANDRVTQSGSSVQNYSFSWDRVGNRSTQTAATGYLTHTLASNSNRLVVVSGSAWRSFTYDGVGNLASESRWDGSRSYRYDGFHRMNGITVNGNASSYLVNALNQRVSKSACT